MPDTEETKAVLRARLAARLAALGKTPHAVSKAIGANAGYVRDLLDPAKTSIPGGARIALLASELETTPDHLLGRSEAASERYPSSEATLADRRLPFRPSMSDATLPLVGTGDCAALEVSDESGHMVAIERSSFDPDYHMRMIVRPPALAGVQEAYAIEFRGDSMAPRYEAGDLGIVDPRRAYGAGDYVVVQLAEHEGSAEVGSVLVKRLVRATPRELVLEQFNPPMVFTLPRSRVVHIHRILRDIEYWS